MTRRLPFLFVFLAAVLPYIYAQPPMPSPAPELKSLDYFVGTWKMDADMKPGPYGPGGKMTMTEHNEWMPGNFFVVSHSEAKSSTFSGTGLAVMGYDPDEKVYTYHEFNSMGEATASKGTHNGNTWSWTSDQKMGDKVIQTRFTIKELSPGAYNFKYEMSPDGSQWMTVMDGKAAKQ
ncbi:MAG TPA: DUF1579 family protein [Terriglobales bacterium]|nr:DUF1579 family protein [Terriglobales bacterium]